MLFQNGNCPKCGQPVKFISYDADPSRRDIALKNYICATCGIVEGDSVSLRTPKRRTKREPSSAAPSFPDAGHDVQSKENTMTQVYQNKPVTNVRAARKGDEGFDASKDQVVIRCEDGTAKTVLRTEVSDKA